MFEIPKLDHFRETTMHGCTKTIFWWGMWKEESNFFDTHYGYAFELLEKALHSNFCCFVADCDGKHCANSTINSEANLDLSVKEWIRLGEVLCVNIKKGAMRSIAVHLIT